MDINFELYKIFYYTAREGSFSEAAAKLFITQSAVSQAVKNLEERLGQELFSRKSRSISLTSEGAVLYKYIEQAYNFIKSGESRLEELKNLESGIIRLGAGDTVCKHFLVPYLDKFVGLHPNIKVKVINRTTVQLINALKSGYLDMCVITLPIEDQSISVTDFRKVEDVFVASPRYEHLRGRKVSLEELCGNPLLMLPEGSATRRNLDSFLEAHGIKVTPEIELESIDLLVDFARIGLGIAHVLKESALPSIKRNELFIVETMELFPVRSLGTATVGNVPLSRASAEFLEFLSRST